MTKVRYDVSKATASGDWEHVQPGLYIFEVREMNAKVSKKKPDGSGGNKMLEVILKPTAEADGTKLDGEFSQVYYYVLVDGSQDGRLRALTDALGLNPKGTIDTEEVVGEQLLGHVKSDKDQDGEYRPRIAKVMPVPSDVEVDEAEEEEDEEPEEEEDEGIDLSELDRVALKKLIKDNELEVRVLKSMSDDDIRQAIAEALGGDEEPEDEEEEDESEDESNGYDEMSIQDLKNTLKERGLTTTGKKSALVARLSEDDQKGGDPF